MPGEKRKLEEHTWISPQSKKTRGDEHQIRNLLPNNVYYSTLVKLRSGARNFFEKLTSTSTPTSIEFLDGNNANTMPTPSAPEILPVQQQSSCEKCSRFGRSAFQASNVCNYCEKQICHQNLCHRCKHGFCNACCFQNYENDDASDNFICIGCLD